MDKKYTAECIVCGAEHHYRTKKELNAKLRSIWSNIRKIFLRAYDAFFIYSPKI